MLSTTPLLFLLQCIPPTSSAPYRSRHFAAAISVGLFGVVSLLVFSVRRTLSLQRKRLAYRQTLLSRLRTIDHGTEEGQSVLRQAFTYFDRDRSGDINLREMRILLRTVFPRVPASRMKTLVKLNGWSELNRVGIGMATFLQTVEELDAVRDEDDERVKTEKSCRDSQSISNSRSLSRSITSKLRSSLPVNEAGQMLAPSMLPAPKSLAGGWTNRSLTMSRNAKARAGREVGCGRPHAPVTPQKVQNV